MSWDYIKDLFIFELSTLANKADGLGVTKRSILKIAAGMYDSPGIVSPVLVSMKVLFQELSLNKVEWDEELKNDEKKWWVSWVEDLKGVGQISVARCVYRASHDQTNCFSVTLLTSKTRVAPLKTQMIPRPELMSGRVLAKLMETVQHALKEEDGIKGSCQWLDRKTALWWINNRGEWKQFVHQRVNEILRMLRKEDWAHCTGEENPANIA